MVTRQQIGQGIEAFVEVGNDSRHQEKPVTEACEESQGICPEAQGIGRIGVQANLLEKVGRCVGEAQSTDQLTTKDHTGDLGTTELEALEAIIVGSANGQLLFEVVCVYNLCQCSLGIQQWVGCLKTAN